MRRILAISLVLLNLGGALLPMAHATPPPPKFLLRGSASSCLASGNVTDYYIDNLSGYHWMLSDAHVCYSANNGASWTEMTAGGPYSCFVGTGTHLKRFQIAPNGTIVMLTGTTSCSTNAAWYLNNVASPPGTTFTESATGFSDSSIAPWGTTTQMSGVTTQDGHWIVVKTNHSISGTNGAGIWLSNDNGVTYTNPTTRPTFANGAETFGAFADPNSNTRYVVVGAQSAQANCSLYPTLAYTTDTDGANWQFIPYNAVHDPPCGDAWTPLVIPPGQGSYSGKVMLQTNPTPQTSPTDSKVWVMDLSGGPTALTFTDSGTNLVTGTLGYSTWIVPPDWSSRIFGMAVNWTIAGSAGAPAVWTDTFPTFQYTNAVTGNELPNYGASPCNVGSPRPNVCLTMGVVFDKYYNSGANTHYGEACIPMRNGDLYCTELPQSHLAVSASSWTGHLDVGVGNTTGPVVATVSYLDQDTPDSCPAIAGNGTAYAARTKVWSTTNTGIATLDSSGIVTGVAPGTVNPTLTCGGVLFTSPNTITVTSGTRDLTSITVSCSPSSVYIGGTSTCTPTCNWTSAPTTDDCPTSTDWTSSNGAVASITTNLNIGTVTGLTAGTAHFNLDYLSVHSANSNDVTVSRWYGVPAHK